MRRLPGWVVVLLSAACSKSQPVQSATDTAMTAGTRPAASSSSMARGAPASATDVDAVFRGFEQELPAATTLSEENGATLADCDALGGATYTRLQGIARRFAPSTDTALPALVKWARHRNACIREIAIEMLLPRIGHDRSALSAPGMHDPEHHHFHDIMVTLQRYLTTKQIPYDPMIFSGLMLDVTAKEGLTFLRGSWAEPDTAHKNYYSFVEVDAAELRVTSKHTVSDPKTADYTWTTKIKAVTVNERRQLVVTGDYNIESNNQGYQGKKVEPSQFVYTFWPVAPGVVWFKNGEHAYWDKLTKR